MRPVTRPPNSKKYAKYGDALPDLEKCFDKYCSYCERRLPISLEVEHVVPKSSAKRLAKKWDNFLLGCKNCNTVKGKKKTSREKFLWPDVDNTLKAFEYTSGGLVKIAKNLPPDVSPKAEKLISLVGLDRHPGQPANKRLPKRDSRYSDREAVWKMAERHRDILLKDNIESVRTLILDAALGHGFFSVWMTVFQHDADMRRRFIAAFKGTAKDCFGALGEPVLRPNGRI